MEKLYHYLWKSRLFGHRLKEIDGREIEVIDPGRYNMDSGPDFFNSKVRIGDTEWIGNIEIHIKASDWYRHGHHEDPAYDNIILHIVGVSDKKVYRKDGSIIPQAEITFPEKFFRTIKDLSEDINVLRCAPRFDEISSLCLTDWLETLSVERVQTKASRVLDILKQYTGNWEQTCFCIFARSLGFGLNSVPFELLSKSVTLNMLHRHSDHPDQLQAILFGQAGMLDASMHIFDEYFQYLCREYYFLARKYNLQPMNKMLWKFARTRPQNFPHRRIAFLAKACEGGFSIFTDIIEAGDDIEALTEIFRLRLDNYWKNHFDFGYEAQLVPDTLSLSSIRLLIINTAAPLIYAYGASTGDIDLAEKGIKILENLPAENNSLIRSFTDMGVECKDALRSQALIHLRKEYCDSRKCLDCRLGMQLLRKSTKPEYV